MREPVVILKGGKLDSYEYPYAFVEETRIVLEAEAFDADGVVAEVRFFGNGKLLGSAPKGNIESLEVVNPGNGWSKSANHYNHWRRWNRCSGN